MSRGPGLLLALVVLCSTGCGQSVDDPLGDLAALVANRSAGSLSVIQDANPPRVADNPVPVGDGPEQILARGDEFLVLDVIGHSLAVLGIDDFAVLREYDLDAECFPRMMAMTTDSKLVVTCPESNELLLVDPDRPDGSDPVEARLDMPAGEALLPFDPARPGQARPWGVAVIGHRAYVTLLNEGDHLTAAGPGLVLVVDVASWTADRLVELPDVLPYFIHRPRQSDQRLYVSSMAGAVHVLEIGTEILVSNVPVGSIPWGIWEDPAGTVWVADNEAGRLMRTVINDV